MFLLACQGPEPSEEFPEEKTAVEALITRQMEGFDVPGMAVGIIKNGEVVYAGAHGVRALDTRTPLSTTSLFHMASVSKPFVATAVVQLVEKGKIDLDERLTHYLPYFTMADERYKDISIRHMLNHSSGIPDEDDYEWDKPQYDDGAAERYASSFGNVQLDFTPGEGYSYSNPAFDILAAVIAKVSGESFEDYVKTNILDPVGMVNSTFYQPDVPEELATKPHVLGNDLQREVSKIYPYNRRHAPSSTLHSNVEDMLRWARVNLNKGEIDGNRIYEETSYELLTQPQTKINENAQVCLSWFRSDFNSTIKFSHSGGDTGYSTYFAFIPENQSAIAVMVNGDRFWQANTANAILNNVVYSDSIHWQSPIHFALKNHILTEGIEKVKEVYRLEEGKTPQDYLIEPGFLDDLGYWLMDRGQPEKALSVFKFMVELEPEYSGWPDSVADAYVALDSTQLAIEWYEKALAINPEQDFTIRKLKELIGE